MSIYLFMAIPLVFLILILIFRYRTTFGILFSLYSIICILEYFLIKNSDKSLLINVLVSIVAILFLLIDFVQMVKSSKLYDFGNYQIISIHYFVNLLKNKKEKKVIGEVIPFSPITVKHGGDLIPLPLKNTTSGTIITGSTGSGKSYMTQQLIKQDMEAGRSIVYFDFKGEYKTYKELKEIALEHGYEVFGNRDPEDKYFFDPLYNLSQEGRVEAIMNTRKWDVGGADAHYKTNLQKLINQYIKRFDAVVERRMMEKGDIDENFKYTQVFYNYISKNRPDLSDLDVKNAYKTLITLLELMLESDFGKLMKYDKGENIRLFNPRDDRYILIISISSDSKELANSFSSFYLRSLLYLGTREPFNDLFLYIDEAASANPYNYKDLLEKGRSSRIHTTLIMQDIHQMDIETNESFTNSLLGTCVNFLIFAGATKSAAERISGVQSAEIEKALQNLNRPPKVSALFITKQPVLNKHSASEFFKFRPYVVGQKPKIDLFGSVDKEEQSQNKEMVGSEYFVDDFDDIDTYKDKQKEIKKSRDEAFFEQLEDDMFN